MKVRILLLSFVLVVLATSCSLRKNTAATRNYQAFITRYNIHYNGDQHYRATLDAMERDYADDFSQLLYVHPADARSEPLAPQPSGDFTRSIEKAQKAIELRSIKRKPRRKAGRSRDREYQEWMRREEYNPFIHNSWLMLGCSQYMNGDFMGASTTFNYIARHFSWLPSTVTEARLWQARAYCAMGWRYEAESLLMRIKPSMLDSDRLEELHALVQATYFVGGDNPCEAIKHIRRAVDGARGRQKRRLNFLLGQLLARCGDRAGAREAFKKAGGGDADAVMKLNADVSRSEMSSLSDMRGEITRLRRLAQYDRYAGYRDRINYAIGNLCVSLGDTVGAVDAYSAGVSQSTRLGIDCAVNRLALGAIYFARRRYDLAQPCYAEAVAVLPANYPGYDSVKLRSDVLDELAVYSQSVVLNDSLLRLAAMSPDERLKVVERHVDRLKRVAQAERQQRQREEREAALADNLVMRPQSGAQAPMKFSLNNDDSWYFYNEAVRNAGRVDFVKRWGARRLEDDWRRRDKTTFSISTIDGGVDETVGDVVTDVVDGDYVDKQDSDIYSVEYYLSRIPSTPQELFNANEAVQSGRYNMGLILKDRLGDYDAARDEWMLLLERYPDNVYRLEVYYNMYLMAVRLHRNDEAEHYRQLVLEHFAESPYGVAMRDPDFLERQRRMQLEQDSLYEETYRAYLDNRNEDVHRAFESMELHHPTSALMPRFMFLDALTYAAQGDAATFKNRLDRLVSRFPDADAVTLATSYAADLQKGRRLAGTGHGNVRGMVWSTPLSRDSVVTDSIVAIGFNLDTECPHLLVLLYDAMLVSGNQLLYDIARHNFATFMVRDFDLEPMNFGSTGLLIVRGFNNFEELSQYRRMLDASTVVTLPDEVHPVMMSVDNFNLLLEHGISIDEYLRYVDDEAVDAPVKAVGANDNDITTSR